MVQGAYRRVLLKVSGESFSGEGSFGITPEELRYTAGEVAGACRTGAEVTIVVGGGNIVRGSRLAAEDLVPRAAADWMGMLGTTINAIALTEAIRSLGLSARCLTATSIAGVGEHYTRELADEHLSAGRVVILAGGTGNPFVTTDTSASLRAAELACDVVLKGTKVDGVYSADPKTDPSAERFADLTFAQAMQRKLGIMDLTAMAMCEEHGVCVVVFDYRQAGNLERAVRGEAIGTTVRPG